MLRRTKLCCNAQTREQVVARLHGPRPVRECDPSDRDRGEPRGSAPPTPPYVRARIRRFGGLRDRGSRHGGQAERSENGFGEGHVQRGAIAEPPGAVRGSGGLCRQVLAHPAPTQLRKAGAPALPLLPGDRPQASPDPLVKTAQHRRGLAEAEVASPPSEIARQLLNALLEALAACPSR